MNHQNTSQLHKNTSVHYKNTSVNHQKKFWFHDSRKLDYKEIKLYMNQWLNCYMVILLNNNSEASIIFHG